MTEAGWFVARGTGVMALILLSVVVVLGVGSRSGRPAFGLPRFAVNLVHRNAALLAIALLVVHIVTLLFDPYAKLRVYDLFVPFGAEYRPLYMGLGTLASDVMLILVVTSLLRRYTGIRLWRALHWLAYASWPAAFGHSIGTGTDAGEVWMLAVAAGCLLAVLAALGWRVMLWLRPRPRQAAAGAASRGRPPELAAGAVGRARTGEAADGSSPLRQAWETAGDTRVRPGQDWSYPGAPVGWGYDAAPVTGGYGAAPVATQQPSYATSPSLLDMYRKPTPGHQPAETAGPSEQPFPSTPAKQTYPPERPAYVGGQPDYSRQPDYGGQPDYSRQPDYSGQPDYSRQPDYSGQPDYSRQPDYGGQPDYTTQPDYRGWSDDGGPAYSAAASAVGPAWSEEDRYQPAAEYVAMYGGGYQAADPGDGYAQPVDPVDPYGAPSADTGGQPWPAGGDHRRFDEPSGYRGDPQAVSSGWRR
ncbi:ferric reductase-like transmembrane domain-containing protein [Micromonospora sp. LOL_023]|uniref:ferric reductase-like transmembrane domain-containing protein n=1 Tax=Micromonospora sp. LOL_023 TaxID=3345418 RepID=UPI003A87D990